MDEFLSLKSEKIFKGEIIEKKSRFLSFSKYVENSEEAEIFLRQIKLKHQGARHICFAYRLLNTSRLSDDGEPSGTAGKPILSLIEKLNLFSVIVVVVRYFGGIKLGAGPLLRAYQNSAQEVLKPPFAVYEKCFSSKLTLSFKEYEKLLPHLLKNELKAQNVEFSDSVCLEAIYPQTFKQKFKEEKNKKEIFFSFKEQNEDNKTR